eukprot:243981_1
MSDKRSNNNFFLIQLSLNLYKKLCSIFGAKSVVVFAIISVLIYKFRAKKHDNIPGAPLWLPILGHMPLIAKYFERGWLLNEVEILNKMGKNIGMFSCVIPTQTQIYCADPKIADLIFREKFSDAIKGDSPFGALKVLLGDGIFTSNGAVWKKHRAIASHMFTVRSLRDYMFEVFVNTTDNLLNKFDELLANNDNIIDFYDMWNRLTFEAFTKIAFGVDVGAISSAPQLAEFGYRFDKCSHLCAFRFFSPIPWKLRRKFKIFGLANYEYEIDEHAEWMEHYVSDIIKDRKSYYQEKISGKTDQEKRKLKRGKSENKLRDRFDLLSMFMDDNKEISDKELRDITFSFIIAGKDTTAQMLSWFMYHIFTNNLVEIEGKIREEINNIFGSDDNELKMTYDNVHKCKYIECCLKETLRLYPSVPHLNRTPIKDIETPNGYIIRKGDAIMISTYAMGRLPWIWKEPLKFKPERFMDMKNQPDPSKYPAFNIAPRLCLGKHVALMEGKIALIKLFTKYKNIVAVEGQNVQWVPSPTNQMNPGFKVYVKKKR